MPIDSKGRVFVYFCLHEFNLDIPVLYNNKILWLFLVVVDENIYDDSLVRFLLSYSNTDHT
jgi:hypothetical protein